MSYSKAGRNFSKIGFENFQLCARLEKEIRLNYLAAAFDYDGTLASDGRVFESTITALQKIKDSGRKLLMVSGRELEDLFRVFPQYEMFDLLVLENGALLYNPATKQERKLTEDASQDLINELKRRKVEPVNYGRCIISTWAPSHQETIEAIHALGLELQIIFNKGSVMILPSGCNKGTGLMEACKELGLSPHNVVGAGDAENDHAFLALCQVAVAVSNALPALKDRADVVTTADHGAGIEEMTEMLLKDEFAHYELKRQDLVLGQDASGEDVKFAALGKSILIAGPSGGGKSNATLGILDTLSKADYQFCLIDPEGDYEAFEKAVVLGDAKRAPRAEEVLQLLRNPDSNAIVNLLGLPLADRPGFFSALLPRLQDMRAEFGRPHWIVIDEAHHLLPAEWKPAKSLLPQEIDGLLMITVHPGLVSPEILQHIDIVLAISEQPEKTIEEFAKVVEKDIPTCDKVVLEPGQAIMWQPGVEAAEPKLVNLALSTIERRRHRRKYAEGELPEDRSFYFTGPHKLKLRAQNLITFRQLADGLDDETWLYHLERKEYSTWFKNMIKDDELAEVAEQCESAEKLSPKESRGRILDAIEERYTAPAETK
ncbi:MAG: HAD-IIB family hydrolase [Candidatus Melainabacteria bacterium]|nr:HAD-IIB family hydrolase [Candidatus Melainabacteria bacterium]